MVNLEAIGVSSIRTICRKKIALMAICLGGQNIRPTECTRRRTPADRFTIDGRYRDGAGAAPTPEDGRRCAEFT